MPVNLVYTTFRWIFFYSHGLCDNPTRIYPQNRDLINERTLFSAYLRLDLEHLRRLSGFKRFQARHPSAYCNHWCTSIILYFFCCLFTFPSGWVVLSGKTHIVDPHAGFRNAFAGSSRSSNDVSSVRSIWMKKIESIRLLVCDGDIQSSQRLCRLVKRELCP